MLALLFKSTERVRRCVAEGDRCTENYRIGRPGVWLCRLFSKLLSAAAEPTSEIPTATSVAGSALPMLKTHMLRSATSCM